MPRPTDLLTAARGTASEMRRGLRAHGSRRRLRRHRCGDRPDGKDPFALRDPEYIARTLPAWRALSRLYFRADVRGMDHIPARRVRCCWSATTRAGS